MRQRHIRVLALALAFVSILVVAGCGLVPSKGSCDRRPGEPVCEDLLTNPNNQLSATFDSLCSIGKGKYTPEQLCDHSGALGGCECKTCENGDSVTWFFAGAEDGSINTVDDVKAKCTADNHDFVEP